MRWYLLVSMLIFLNIVAPMQAAPLMVPSLDWDRDALEDSDDLFMRMSQPSVEKIPQWQIIMQQWGSLLAAHVLRFKDYAIGQYEKIKMIMYAMLYRNSPMPKK